MVEVDSKFTKMFVSNGLTRLKYNELLAIAMLLLKHRNVVSELISSDLYAFLEMSPMAFLKLMRRKFKGVIPSSLDTQLYLGVFVAYKNRQEAITRKLLFEKRTFIGFEFYKRDTKKNKKGDLKKVITEKKQTPLSSCLTYLSRYGNDNTIEYIREHLDGRDEKKRKFYENILRCIDKFGFEKLMKLALERRDRVIKKASENPIVFHSLTFRGRCRKKDIISYNRHYGSVINAFIVLSGLGRDSFCIPVKFNKSFHGNMRDYHKKSPDYEYTIKFNEKKKSVSVLLCKDGKRLVPEAHGEVCGIDVNIKHNLFALSDGITFDIDRKLVDDYCKLLTEIDRRKKENKDYKPGKRKQHQLDTMKVKIVMMERELIVSICQYLIMKGVFHVVFEDLDGHFGKCYVRSKDNDGINYNRIVRFIGLASLKDEFKHIAHKYGIAVSLVHASYTSKMCPICGCIEDENRPDQETFKCIGCGHEANADINAAINIRNRVTVTVLRDRLLKQLDNGSFEPKRMNRESVKKVLLSFRRSQCVNVGSESS